MRGEQTISVLGFVVLSALSATSAGYAAVIQVPPGAGTLQAAIDAASDGDTLVGAGMYTGPVVITKSLKIQAAKLGAIQIDAECLAPIGLTIAADEVRIKGPVSVQGATLTAIFIDDTSKSKLHIVSAAESCGTATTGIDIHESDHLMIRGGNVFDFVDQVFRLEGQGPKSAIKISRMHGLGSTTGFVFEDIAADVDRKGAGILIQDTFLNGGVQTGFAFTEADGIVVQRCEAFYMPVSVTLDALSSNNVFHKNTFGGTVVDAGSGNCFKGNPGYPDSCP